MLFAFYVNDYYLCDYDKYEKKKQFVLYTIYRCRFIGFIAANRYVNRLCRDLSVWLHFFFFFFLFSLSLIILIYVTSVLLSPYVIHLVSSTLVIWDSFIVPHQYRIRVIHLRHCNGIALTPHEPLIACNKYWHFVWLCVIDPILFFIVSQASQAFRNVYAHNHAK